MKGLLMTFWLSLLLSSLQAQCPESLVTSEKNLITNGDFEEDGSNFKTEYVQSVTANADAGIFSIVTEAKTFSPGFFVGAGDGKFMAVDGSMGANKIVWQQEIEVKENATYFFSAWVSTLYEVKPAVLQFSVNGELLDKPFVCPDKRKDWQQFFSNWHSDKDTKIRITIVSQNPGMHGNDFGLDRIKFYECVSSSLTTALERVEKDKVIELRNVLFETASSEIIHTSYAELDILIKYLQSNPAIEIEIAGHTDTVGNETYNLKLSQDRANAIGRYLIDKKVAAKRLAMKGYGMQLPVASNETLEGRQKNRRVEFKISKM